MKSVINQTTGYTKERGRIVIPCSADSSVCGFVIEGIHEQFLCTDGEADLLALVYHYLLRSTRVDREMLAAISGKGACPDEQAAQDVFALAVVMLQMLKNNMTSGSHQLQFTCDLSADGIRHALHLINTLAKRFARLADRTFRELSYRSKSGCHIAVRGGSGDITVKPLRQRTVCREMWYGSRICYHLTERHLPDLEQLLHEISPYAHFAEGQLEALTAFLEGASDSVCVMPTGSGKSLVYYMAVLLQPLPALVIVPTEILILDQLRNLREIHHIDDAAWLSMTEDSDFRAFDPRTRLTYMTPATFQDRDLLARFVLMDCGTELFDLREERIAPGERLSYVVLDEIHCMSNWGHDFRPEYLMLSRHLHRYLRHVPILGLTGTADLAVVNDLHRQLSLEQGKVISPVSYEKYNVRYQFLRFGSIGEMQRTAVDLIREQLTQEMRTIVFTRSAEAAQLLGEMLDDQVCVFQNDDQAGYQAFLEGRSCVLIAGKNLGIGVNIPHVRCTIHYGLSLSKNEYVQEIGRAGRAGEQVTSYVLYTDPQDADVPAALFERENAEADAPVCETVSDYADIIRQLYRYRSRKELEQQLYTLYSDLEARNTAVVTECFAPEEREKKKRLLYMLYCTGYLEDWYAARPRNGQPRTMVNIRSTNSYYFSDPGHMLHRMQEQSAEYLRFMGDEASADEIERAPSADRLLERFSLWYYTQFMYRQKETFLDLAEFITANENSSDEHITEELQNYYSLPYEKLKADEKRYKDLTPDQVLDKVCRGISRTTLSDLERVLNDQYYASIDYLLLLGNLRWDRFSASRLQRILSGDTPGIRAHLQKSLLQVAALCGMRGRFSLLQWLEAHGDTLGISFDAFVSQLYQTAKKDSVYYGLLAMRLNPLF